jgi:hypothetical protein
MSETSEIRRAIEKGVAYLESAQLPSGEIPIETSSTPEMTGDCVRSPVVFAAALAARVLSVTPSAQRVRSRALDFLEREMSSEGLWRHPSSEFPEYLDTPLDLDDTSIASAALAAAGRPFPDNRHVLLAHRKRDGLFQTWIVQWWRHPIRTCRFSLHYRNVRLHDIDSVINANVVIYLGVCEETQPAIAHMLAVLRANREMMATVWYWSHFTVWYFFSQALREIAPEAGEMIVPRIEATAPINALELAFATSTLLLWNRVPDVGPLIDAQLPSGAWPRAAMYHTGLGRMDSQPRAPWWGSEALTTVFAVEALTRRLLVEE